MNCNDGRRNDQNNEKLAASVVEDGGEKDNHEANGSDVGAIAPASKEPSKSAAENRRQHNPDDENDASVSSNDGDGEHADETSFTESTNRFPLTTVEGQMAHNPSYTVPMATLAAKREYNRQNAARARKRAKTLLHAYQEQIQVLTTQLAQLREQNKSLLETLRLLQEENMRIHQNQQAAEDMNHSSVVSDRSGPVVPVAPPVVTQAAGSSITPPLAINPAAAVVGSNSTTVPAASVQNQHTIPNLLALLYLTGASMQQSAAMTQQQQQQQQQLQLQQQQLQIPTSMLTQQHQTSTLTQYPYILSNPQSPWFQPQNSQPNRVQQQPILPTSPSHTFMNATPNLLLPSNFDTASYISRILMQTGGNTSATNHQLTQSGSSMATTVSSCSTGTSTQDAKVEQRHDHHDSKQSYPLDKKGDTS
jgi:hypothetical protein